MSNVNRKKAYSKNSLQFTNLIYILMVTIYNDDASNDISNNFDIIMLKIVHHFIVPVVYMYSLL